MSIRIQLIFGCAAVLLASCSSDPTRIVLMIEYDDAWGIGTLEVRSGERMKSIPAQHSIELWVPDSWAGTEVSIRMRGLRGEESIASGGVMVTPVLGGSTEAIIVLHRVACGAWCTEGETRCFGDAVAICEQRDGDPCMEWGTPIACASDAPYCSLGACRPTCIDECAEGEQRCDGPNGYQLCGNFDGDTCREWSTATTCEEGQSCNAGTCITGECRDQCTSGDTECRGSSVVTCGDLNADGCTEWGPATRCASMSCNAGQCTEACTDECSVDACAGSSFHECGQFDEDPCLDRSPGLSCTPADLCLEGACSDATGCTSTARTCDDPPAQTCIDANTLRVYDAVGECTVGDCNYTPRDIACATCPSCDPCAGVTCNMPPAATCANSNTRRTYATSGSCTAGACSYSAIDSACSAPPAATCVDASTLRTYMSVGTCSGGTCTYSPIDMNCPAGCAASAGACRHSLCSPVPPLCTDASILNLNLFSNPNPAPIENIIDGRGFSTHVDASGGGVSPSLSYVYARFTDAGLVAVNVGDEAAFDSTEWDIAFRRLVIRLNSGVSGPSCVAGARALVGTNYESLAAVPDGLDYNIENYFNSRCEFVAEGSGLGLPRAVLQSFWSYVECAQMTGNVYIVRLASGRRLKLTVTSYYSPEIQSMCNANGTLPSGMASGAGHLRFRWAFLD
jgi:hypothetical protein